MLQNAYLLAKIGADTAENEQHFAEILPTDALWRLRRAFRCLSDEITLANGEGGDPYRFLADHAFDSRSPGTPSYASQERVLRAEYNGQR